MPVILERDAYQTTESQVGSGARYAPARGPARYPGIVQARLAAQRPRSGPTLLALLLMIGAAAIAAVRIAGWANSALGLAVVDDLAQQWDRREPAAHHVVGAIPTPAPDCAAGPQPTFSPAFVELSQDLGEVMGQPLECAHVDPATGDRLQATSTGLAVYRAASLTATFTDGYRHWALRAQQVITWQGDATDPPESAAGPPESVAGPPESAAGPPESAADPPE